MRLFSVSEEMLPIDPVTLQPASLTAEMVLRYERGTGLSNQWDIPNQWDRPSQAHSALSVGLFGGQIHVTGPTQSSTVELLETLRIGRALADRAARTQGRRAAALGSPVFHFAPLRPEDAMRGGGPSLGTKPRHPSMCGFHMQVAVDSPEEGVQVLDRVRIWLPVLLALSTNSPFWHGRPSRFNSYRYFACSKWPAPGPTEVFGSENGYERQMRHLTHPAAARSAPVTHLDAQLSDTRESVDVLLADVCLNAEHGAALAGITRALVEVMVRQWREGIVPATTSVAELRASSWWAAVNGLEGKLMSPRTRRLGAVGDVVLELLELVRPVLREYDEYRHVAAVIRDMLHHGNGSRSQRNAYALKQDPHDVVADALRRTHDPNHSQGVPGAILAETWVLNDTEQLPIAASWG